MEALPLHIFPIMKLYYSPGACSLSPQIVLQEAGLPYEPVLASTKTHQLKDGTDFYTINPLGYVPVLELDNGTRLREGVAIVQYIADQVPAKKLAPTNGSFERYQLQEWLNFIATEVHKGFGPLFRPTTPESYKPIALASLTQRLQWLDTQLAGKNYLMGEQFSVADAYFYTISRWCGFVGLDLSALKNIQAFQQRMEQRPAVQAALKIESQA